MATLTRRLQLLLDEEQYGRVAAKAEREHSSVAAVIRSAIDRSVAAEDDERVAAMQRFLAAEPMEVPADPADLKREIEQMFEDRARRWE